MPRSPPCSAWRLSLVITSVLNQNLVDQDRSDVQNRAVTAADLIYRSTDTAKGSNLRIVLDEASQYVQARVCAYDTGDAPLGCSEAGLAVLSWERSTAGTRRPGNLHPHRDRPRHRACRRPDQQHLRLRGAQQPAHLPPRHRAHHPGGHLPDQHRGHDHRRRLRAAARARPHRAAPRPHRRGAAARQRQPARQGTRGWRRRDRRAGRAVQPDGRPAAG